MNIYAVATKILDKVISCETYQNSSFFEQTYAFLTTENSPFEIFLQKFDKNTKKNLKRVMMLTIFSGAYKMLLRNKMRQIDSEISDKLLSKIEALDASSIIKAYYGKDVDFIRAVFANYFDYSERNYIFHNFGNELIKKYGKGATFLRINPFEIYNLESCLDDERFVHSENVIQIFIDLYDRTSIVIDELLEDDFAENLNAYIISDTFKALTEEFFNGETTQITNFYAMILSNVYEGLIVNLKYCKSYQDLLDIFSENSGLDIITIFLNNKQFAERVLDLFFVFNEDISKEDLLHRRFRFLKSKSTPVLEELNPYFAEENQILKRKLNDKKIKE